MVKGSQAFDALTQCRLELRVSTERRSEPEYFPGGRARVVEHQQTVAKTVGMSLRVPGGERFVTLRHRRVLVDDEIVSHGHGISILILAVGDADGLACRSLHCARIPARVQVQKTELRRTLIVSADCCGSGARGADQ